MDRLGINLKRAVNQCEFMEKEKPQPKTQPSGNKPPPRPPNRTTIGMLPEDEGSEKNQRRMRQENLRIDLPSKPFADPTIKLTRLATASVTTSNKTQRTWPVALLLILAVWAFIGAVVNMTLFSVFSDTSQWEQSRNLEIALLLLLLGAIPAQIIRYPNGRR
jgi:hypothetical protein